MLVGFGKDLSDFKLMWVSDPERTSCTLGDLDDWPYDKKSYAKAKADMVEALIQWGLKDHAKFTVAE